MTRYVLYFGVDGANVDSRYGSTPDREQAARWIWQLIDEGKFIRLEREG